MQGYANGGFGGKDIGVSKVGHGSVEVFERFFFHGGDAGDGDGVDGESVR